MKKFQIISIILTLAMLTFWSCSDDSFTAVENDALSSQLKAKGGNGKGGEAALFSVTYDGTIFQSQAGCYQQSTNNKRFSILSYVDGEFYQMNTGFAQLIGSCYSDPICSIYHEVRQFDKKKNPEKVAAHFSFYVGDDINLLRFSMQGTIEEEPANEYSIYPPDGVDRVLTFTKWKLDGFDSACAQEEFVDFANAQSITIRLIDVCPDGC